MSVYNESNFKCSSEDIFNYIKSACKNMVDNNKFEERDNIIYISAPVTGIEEYKQTFDLMKEYIKYIYHDRDVFIINPNDYIDNIPEELNPTYIDKVLFGLELLKFADCMFIYDDNKEAWEKSRGCLVEATYAVINGISIFNYDYTLNAAKARNFLDNEGESCSFMLYLKEHDIESYNMFREAEIRSSVEVEGDKNEKA